MRIIGKKIITQTNIMESDNWLADASQTNKLDDGSLEEGNRKGNRLKPTVPIIPRMLNALKINAHLGRKRIHRNTPSAPPMPINGATHKRGYCRKLAIQAPTCRATFLCRGLE